MTISNVLQNNKKARVRGQKKAQFDSLIAIGLTSIIMIICGCQVICTGLVNVLVLCGTFKMITL